MYGVTSGKEPAYQSRRHRDANSIPKSGRSPRGKGNQQYSYLENAMDRVAWWATVHRVTQSQAHLSDSLCCIPETNTTL